MKSPYQVDAFLPQGQISLAQFIRRSKALQMLVGRAKMRGAILEWQSRQLKAAGAVVQSHYRFPAECLPPEFRG
jgi:hypothetical protein